MQAFWSKASTQAIASVALVVVFAWFNVLNTPVFTSSDLFATWLAGVQFEAGAFDNIYPPAEPIFTMTPPPGWQEIGEALGRSAHRVYPFIYPPLWAYLASHLTEVTSFETVATVASYINALLLVGTIALAGMAARLPMALPLYICIGFFAMHFTMVGHVATLENQPQILVSFLIVLTIERLRSGDQRTAGAALALAAGIKVYPAIFALMFLATRSFRAFAWFVAIGGALGLSSIVVAGWPLHLLYLEQLSTISDSILLTVISINFYSFFGQVIYPDALQLLNGAVLTEESEQLWHIMPKPSGWGPVGAVCLGLALVAFGRAFAVYNDNERVRILWPLLIVVATLLSPISWPYYLIPSFAFLPVFVGALGWTHGMIAIFVLITPFILPVWIMLLDFEFVEVPGQFFLTLATIVLAIAFALLLRAQNLR